MILRQFLHSEPVAASYLFGCGGGASAAVVDPVGDIAPYLRAAEETGMRILYAIDDATDFVRFMVAEIPPAPPEAAAVRAANAGRVAAAA